MSTASGGMGSSSLGIKFDNRNLRELPLDKETKNFVRSVSGAVYSRVKPTPVKAPALMSFSEDALALLGIAAPSSDAEREELTQYMAGNQLLDGSDPAAHCYCGHQFGNFAGQLGDGAAISLGEVLNDGTSQRWELQLKGAGPTPYSRSADGRKVLRSSIREYLMSEGMHYLGIPTTRAATIVTSDSRVVRDPHYDGTRLNERCTVVSRLAPNFFRFGSFEIFKGQERGPGARAGPSAGDATLRDALTDHLLTHFFPDAVAKGGTSRDERVVHMFSEVVRKTAELVAAWDAVGWVHGVLNTDNMSMMGLTIDYGPYGFMETCDPEYTPNGSDGSARYSYGAQREMCRWNCGKLAEALEAYMPRDAAEERIQVDFDAVYQEAYLRRFSAKLGLTQVGNKGGGVDAHLVEDVLDAMTATYCDFTDGFLALQELAVGHADVEQTLERLLSRCAPPAEMTKYLERKMQISKLGMHPQQIMQVWTILQETPEKASDLFGGVPIEAIENEIGGEKRKLDKLVRCSETLKALETTDVSTKRAADERVWRALLETYSQRLAEEGNVYSDDTLAKTRSELTSSQNPTFVLRNWVAQDAIAAAEKGDFSKVNTVLDMLKTPYAPHFSPFADGANASKLSEEQRAFVGLGPEWAAGLICTCSS